MRFVSREQGPGHFRTSIGSRKPPVARPQPGVAHRRPSSAYLWQHRLGWPSSPGPAQPETEEAVVAEGQPEFHQHWTAEDERLRIETFATGWHRQIGRFPVVFKDTPAAAASPPQLSVVPIRFQPRRPKVLSVVFPETDLLEPSQASGGEGADAATGPRATDISTGPRPPTAKQTKRTRIRPPADLVKLEDRLFFLLQPPIEFMAAAGRLDFPFAPFPYQLDGIAFLFPRETAILADEMGLGKTMQAITAVRMLLLARHLRNVLLVCPKPLVTNWVREFRLWAPEIPVTVVEGDAARRQWIWQQPNVPVRIANYELLMRDFDLIENAGVHFDLVILDEAQRIKNRNSTTAQVARSLPRTRSWALTGTPIENSVDDLVHIFEFLHPGYLSTGMPLKAIRQATRDHIIRRTKDTVLTEMPPKMFRDEELVLTPEQQCTYQMAEKEGVVQLEDLGETLTIQHVFELVLRLKQICNFDPATGASCKLERLEADLEEIAASGQKAIVFSQWVETLEKLAGHLARFGPMQYHGRVPSKQRDAVIQQFREDPTKHVILMSYGAGSVGLNLQFCQYVFLFDRWWNPAVEDQAINRAHRIGAAGPVTVTRMMAAETIEQRIHQVLEEKRELFNQLFADGSMPRSTGLSREEIFGLFNLSVPGFKARKAS
ncbi:MAG: DEAD/DEAH box helicase [Planctomycetota bacterium]|nr:MAG: DEAD/DEAH box helicase [Planctomycetota bacterium]